jgi:hypothetical protein
MFLVSESYPNCNSKIYLSFYETKKDALNKIKEIHDEQCNNIIDGYYNNKCEKCGYIIGDCFYYQRHYCNAEMNEMTKNIDGKYNNIELY